MQEISFVELIRDFLPIAFGLAISWFMLKTGYLIVKRWILMDGYPYETHYETHSFTAFERAERLGAATIKPRRLSGRFN